MNAYKGTDKNMQCRGYQFEVGKEHSVDGEVSLCGNGFHACESPMNVMRFYSPDKSRYFEVDQSGEKKSDDEKTVSQKIRLTAEIGIIGLVKAHVDWVWSMCKKEKNGANAATTGYSANAATTGEGANAATTGNGANAATTGNGANAATTGYMANAATTGKNSISAAIGINSRAMTRCNENWIVITDWRIKNGEWIICKVCTLKPGMKLQRKTIKAGVWYWFENGKLKSEAERKAQEVGQ